MQSIINVSKLLNTNHEVKTGFNLIIKNKTVPFFERTEIICKSSNKDGLNKEMIFILRRNFGTMIRNLEHIIKEKHCHFFEIYKDGDSSSKHINLPEDYIINIT